MMTPMQIIFLVVHLVLTLAMSYWYLKKIASPLPKIEKWRLSIWMYFGVMLYGSFMGWVATGMGIMTPNFVEGLMSLIDGTDTFVGMFLGFSIALFVVRVFLTTILPKE
jgi:hypothetical protein